MKDEPMTATEVKQRRAELSKTFDGPNFDALLDAIIRILRRAGVTAP